MLKKIKTFLIKNKVFVIIIAVFLLVLALVLVLLLPNGEKDDTFYAGEPWEEEAEVYYENYQINFPEDLVAKTNLYVDTYSTFSVKDVNHLDWVEDFVSATRILGFEYTEKAHPAVTGDSFHTIDQSTYYWQRGNNFITYDNATDILSFKFDAGIEILDVQMDSEDKESVKLGIEKISEKLFSEDFEYVVHEISSVGNNYRLDYSRLLEGVPIGQNPWNYYLILTPRGTLKQGNFLLAEFEKSSEISIPSGEEIKEKMNKREHRKFISFEFLDEIDFEEFGPYGYDGTGYEVASIDLEFVDLEYRYHSKFNDIVEPIFSFGGEGYVEIKNERFRVYFDVRIE